MGWCPVPLRLRCVRRMRHCFRFRSVPEGQAGICPKNEDPGDAQSLALLRLRVPPHANFAESPSASFFFARNGQLIEDVLSLSRVFRLTDITAPRPSADVALGGGVIRRLLRWIVDWLDWLVAKPSG
jgi:hypothetical protein